MTPAQRTSGYAFVVFLSSAILLVLEVVAGRLIAPYVGMSLYTWTAIIGVILAGLSLGNWIGGVWADRGAGERETGHTLLAGALSCPLLLIVLHFVGVPIQNSGVNLLGASFLFVLALFFLPAVLLGVVTPLLTTLALRLDTRQGHVVGRMHALAALGSILGTFLTGYVLVQWLGTRAIVLGCGVLLFLLALPFLRATPRMLAATLLLAGALGGGVWATRAHANPCMAESSYFCIRVVDKPGLTAQGRVRALVLDHLVHGMNHDEQPALLVSPYVHLMAEMMQVTHGGRGPLNSFFAGGGAYTLPRGVAALFPGSRVRVAEIDEAVTTAAAEKMFLDTAPLSIVHQDARWALQHEPPASLDVVAADAFHDIAIPYHLTTREFNRLVKSRLKPDGLYVLNVLDVFPNPLLAKSMLRTLREDFRQVSVWLDRVPREAARMTFVIAASDAHEWPRDLWSKQAPTRRWVRVDEPLSAAGTPLASLPVLTDDQVPVERLVSSMLFGQHGL